MNLKNEIKEFAKYIGINIVGFTGVEQLNEVKDILIKRKKAGLETPFESKDIEKRVNPLKLFPQAKTIMVLGISYYYDISSKKNTNYITGKVARYTRVKDYHKILREKMSLIMDFIEKRLSYRPEHLFLVDTAPLVERYVALQAGIGCLGQNAFIINKDYGSYIVLGEILIDLDLEEDLPAKNSCLKCDQCLKACPTGALKKPYTINPNLCISYWTQAKEDIPRNIRPLIQNRIVGCDICQEICPHNRDIKKGSENTFEFFPDLVTLNLVEILQMSNKEFKKTFGDTAASWCGKRVLQRNALVALGNSGNREVVPTIISFLDDERPQIRLHAAWALGQLGGYKAHDALQKQLKKEEEKAVREEILYSLKNLSI